MSIYLLNIFLIILFGVVFLWYKPTQKNKKIFCVIVTIQWILLSGLRNIIVGADTRSYKNAFDIIKNKPWRILFNNFLNINFKVAEGRDPGYPLFEKFIQIFSNNYRVFLIIIAVIFTVPLGIWIYKNSVEPCISFLIYSCLFYSFFAITGIRQTIATALVVLVGYKFIKKRKFCPFLLIMLLACTIHKSAICFLPFFFIANKKITKRYLILMCAVITGMFIFRNNIISILGNIMGYESYANQYPGAGTWTFTIVLIMVAIVAFWKYRVILKNNPTAKHYINALLIAIVFVPLTYIDPSTMRVVQYYSVFIMLLIPEIIKAFSKRERIIVYYVAVIVLIALYIRNNPQYLFFWQKVL